MAARLTRGFFRRDAETLARALLGQRLIRRVDGGRLVGRIVETEAYLGAPDKAAHSSGGRRTARNEAMWGDAGRAYVYFTYGMHHCMNVVAGTPGDPVAVLIRALEPEAGAAAMARRRTKADRATDLCSGPAKLCQALAVDRAFDGHDLVRSDTLFLESGPAPASDGIARGPRVGVAYAQEWAEAELRFWVADNPHVSRGPSGSSAYNRDPRPRSARTGSRGGHGEGR